jgi:hypothetical protein
VAGMNTSQVDFLKSVSDGFIKSPMQIIISVIMIILFVLFLIILGVVTTCNARKLLMAQLLTKYKKILMLFKITDDEKRMIEKLSVFLTNPDSKYLLFTDPNIFYHTLDKLRAKENVEGLLLHDLEKKLGFMDVLPDKVLNSTHDINNGNIVIIIFKFNKKITGHVIKSEESLKVKVINETNFLIKGKNALIVAYNYTGMYVFNVRLKEYKDGILGFTHSTKFKIYQRRNFYRKNKKRPIFILRKETDNKPETAMILNLSGGGASIDNSFFKFKVGDKFKISFPKVKNNEIIIDAEVVRTSKNNSVIHVKFNDLIPLFIDHIIEIVNS